jgi:hypothetical protein
MINPICDKCIENQYHRAIECCEALTHVSLNLRPMIGYGAVASGEFHCPEVVKACAELVAAATAPKGTCKCVLCECPPPDETRKDLEVKFFTALAEPLEERLADMATGPPGPGVFDDCGYWDDGVFVPWAEDMKSYDFGMRDKFDLA